MGSANVVIAERSWVARFDNEGDLRPQVGQVKHVYPDSFGGGLLADIVLFAPDGRKLGRVSPAMGGPRGFEPACATELWTPIEPPDFEAMCNLYFYGDAIKPLGSVS